MRYLNGGTDITHILDEYKRLWGRTVPVALCGVGGQIIPQRVIDRPNNDIRLCKSCAKAQKAKERDG